MYQVYLVDDDFPILAELVLLLKTAGYKVRSFNYPRDFLAAFSETQVPSVIVCDMRMPELSGIDVLRQLRERGIRTPIIFLSGESTPQEIVDAHDDPDVSYLLKPVFPEKLLSRLRDVIDSEVERLKRQSERVRIQQMQASLTPTQTEVYKRLLRAMNTREIGQDLGMHPETVKKHRQAVLRKFECESLSELIAIFHVS
jgi:two-component system response regulator FixJ